MGASRRATQLRRRPVQSEGVSPNSGFVPLHHEQLQQIYVLCKDRTEMALVLWIMSTANQRNRNGRSDGWTGIQKTADMAAETTISERMINYALKRLAETEVIEVKTVKQARRANIVSSEEAKATMFFGVVVRACTADWKRLQDRQLAEAAEEEPDDEPVPDEQEAATVPICEAPILVEPGRKSEPIQISAAGREAIRRCVSLVADSQILGPVAIDFSIQGSVLECRISEAKSFSIQSKKRTSASPDPVQKTGQKRSYRLSNQGVPVNETVAVSTWQTDRAYEPLIEAYRKTRKPLSDSALADGHDRWKEMLVGERLAAVRGIEDRIKYGIWDDPVYVPLPKNYLKRGGDWELPVEPRKKKAGEWTDEQRVEAVRRLRANPL